jgi:adenylate cyclase class 2
MSFEVEQKFRINDPTALISRLTALHVELGEPQLQVDTYFRHPARDFAQTDEALRIRQVGEKNRITYKGPKIDRTTKTRREIELPLQPSQQHAEQFGELLAALGFQSVTAVRKQRRYGEMQWNGQRVEIALDEVDHVGTFAELELTADQSGLDAARACLASLAAELGLTQVERRSYLELLLEKTKPEIQETSQ